MSNSLSEENSLYLRQHQNNPVNWHPWRPPALDRARQENKLIVVSIGYSSCHWCHVMERESFTQEDVAQIMNQHFVSIKVDREERPDIDQIYMLAVQLMTGQGGWPLNMICLPDGRPVYGGTYFSKEDWKSILRQLAEKWQQDPALMEEYAERLSQGIENAENFPIQPLRKDYDKQDLQAIVAPWKERFDLRQGGYSRAPKFPMPSNWSFLLRYGVALQDQEVVSQVHLTLRKMALGGIYDQLGGGFSRYSVDRNWHVPHFEKMLYDNALLVSLYCQGYQHTPDPLYRKVVQETLEWINREMTSPQGAFFSAIDADSEGVEGKYYTFTQQEFHQALGPDLAEVFSDYFSIRSEGNWEEAQTNILFVQDDTDILARHFGGDTAAFQRALANAKEKLFSYREKRTAPQLDTKVLLSWNAMTITAFADAYRVFNAPEYLDAALKTADFIQEHLISPGGFLLRHLAPQQQQIPGFLDDYAFYIEALLALYEATFQEKWVNMAREWAEYTIAHFYRPGAPAFYYASNHAEQLISKKAELMDDVIPSSNSVLIRQLAKLGVIFDETRFTDLSLQLLANVFPQIQSYGSSFSNWAIYLLEEVMGRYEIVLTGPEFQRMREALDKYYLPNKFLMGGLHGELPLVVGRIGERSRAFVCQNKTCSLPVSTIDDLIKLIFKPEQI